MKFSLERLTDPAIDPVTLTETRTHLRVDEGDASTDSQITMLIENAREWVEDETGQIAVAETWRLSLGDSIFYPFNGILWALPIYYGWCRWLERRIYLRRTPVIEVLDFVSVADDGTEISIDTSTYELREAKSKWPYLHLATGWTPGNYRITYRAGYIEGTGSPTESMTLIPARMRQAMLLHIEANYDRDEKMMPILLDAAANNVARLVAHIPFA